MLTSLRTRATETAWCIVLTIAVAFAAPVSAQINLIDKGEKLRLDLAVEVNAAPFVGSNSYFGNSEEHVGADTDSWFELTGELGLVLGTKVGEGTLFAELSGLYTQTWGDDASGLTVGLDRTYDVLVEQAHVGWRSGETFSGLGEDALTVRVGRFDYTVGTGFLIADGGADGGERGAFWTGARMAFENGLLATLETGGWKAEIFNLGNQNRTGNAEGLARGANLEYSFGRRGVVLSGTWFRVFVDDAFRDEFEGYDTLSLRLDWRPITGLSLGGEYVRQATDSTDEKASVDVDGWYLEGGYQWERSAWRPRVSYRYSHLAGDDPATPENEGFRPAAYGATDYGYWYQGEISGNYVLGHNNLDTHLVRLQLFPAEELVLNAFYYDFTLDQPYVSGESTGGSTDWGDEINVAADWRVGGHVALRGVFGALFPGDAAKNWTGGDKDWLYGMVAMNVAF